MLLIMWERMEGEKSVLVFLWMRKRNMIFLKWSDICIRKIYLNRKLIGLVINYFFFFEIENLLGKLFLWMWNSVLKMCGFEKNL